MNVELGTSPFGESYSTVIHEVGKEADLKSPELLITSIPKSTQEQDKEIEDRVQKIIESMHSQILRV
jgi:hypothetical protein